MENFREVDINYDTSPEDALDIVESILESLGVEYERIDGDVITIKYSLDKD